MHFAPHTTSPANWLILRVFAPCGVWRGALCTSTEESLKFDKGHQINTPRGSKATR
jgi:hypothetical protein